MRRPIGMMAAILMAAAAWAGDPWKEKPYKDWNEKEVRKILNDSPWAKLIRVDAPWIKARGGEESVAPDASAAAPVGGGYEGGRTAAGQPSAGVSPEGEQLRTPQAAFLIRWASARTLRQAMARFSVLRGAVPHSEAEKYLTEQPQEYQVVVLGPDMTPFGQADEKTMKENTYLLSKKSKQKLVPSRVEIRREGDGRRITAVVFHFPRKTESAEATIAPDEKGIEFVCQAGSAVLRSSFEPQKMVDQQGMDL